MAADEIEALVLSATRVAELAARMPRQGGPPDRVALPAVAHAGPVGHRHRRGGGARAFKAGEELAVVEAMKMENVLRAERDGRVIRVVAAQGDSVNADQVILELE